MHRYLDIEMSTKMFLKNLIQRKKLSTYIEAVRVDKILDSW